MLMATPLQNLAGLIAPTKDVITDYNGFPWWYALRIRPNRETKAADYLSLFNVFAYVPRFSKVVRRPGNRTGRKLCAATPGLIFIPVEMVDIPRRDEIFRFARVQGFLSGAEGKPKRLSKADIELIRIMEAKLNAPPNSFVDRKGALLKVGQQVGFVDPLFSKGWGSATVFEVAAEHRIGVEVVGLFGCAARIYVPASEIEVM